MTTTTFFSLEAALVNATERRTAYAAGEIRLFQDSLVPTPTTTLTDLTDNEADYDTYAAEAVANWETPILAESSGYLIATASVQFNTGATDPVTTNMIGGAWYEDATDNVRMITTFDPPLPMQVANQGFPFSFVDLFPTGY